MPVKKSFKSVKAELEKQGLSLSRTTERFTHKYNGYQVMKWNGGIGNSIGSRVSSLQEIIDAYNLDK